MSDGFYSDVALGTMIIRGDNMAMFGELDGSAFDAKLSRTSLNKVLSSIDAQVPSNTALDLGFLDDQ